MKTKCATYRNSFVLYDTDMLHILMEIYTSNAVTKRHNNSDYKLMIKNVQLPIQY